ncbi:MAG: polysaccharide deacetylase family protein [Flavobacteriaceae bacterium]|nr:polysaccharide deacetylase family protein [Flavobacteriaceae bacterium]
MKRLIFNFNRSLLNSVLGNGKYPDTIHIFHHYFNDGNDYLVRFIDYAQAKGYLVKGYDHQQQEGEKVIYLSFDDNYAAWVELAASLKKVGANCTFFTNFAPNLMSDRMVSAYYNSLGLSDGRPVALDQVARLLEQGFDFGNHGMSHVPFGNLQRSHVITDLELNRSFFKDRFGSDLKNVAFPYGSMRYFKKEWVKTISAEFGTVYAGHPLYQTKKGNDLVFRAPLYASEGFEFNLKIHNVKRIDPKFTLGKSLIG